MVSGTYSGIGKRVEEAKGGSTGQVGKGTEIWDGSEGKQKRVKGCPTKKYDNEDEWKDNCNNIIYQMEKHWFMYEFDHEDA